MIFIDLLYLIDFFIFQGNKMYKTAFIVFFQGDQLKNRIQKVCSGFRASLYPSSRSNSERLEMVKGVRTRLEDLKLVLLF